MARGPRCFKCLMFMLSGPVELFVFEFLMALCVSSVVISTCCCGAFLVILFIFRCSG